MKGVLYANLVRQSRSALESEGAGELMTKAISDVDDCAEGMRKFTTELFDTGVALTALHHNAVLLRLAAGAAVLDIPARVVHLRRADEKTGAARQLGV